VFNNTGVLKFENSRLQTISVLEWLEDPSIDWLNNISPHYVVRVLKFVYTTARAIELYNKFSSQDIILENMYPEDLPSLQKLANISDFREFGYMLTNPHCNYYSATRLISRPDIVSLFGEGALKDLFDAVDYIDIKRFYDYLDSLSLERR
jgi:hypothetical protein